jgi:hypothetical protein
MPAFQNITANDREDTPVAHTFTPRGKENGVAVFKESDGTPIGDNIVTVSTRKAGEKYKSRLRLTMPITADEVVNGITSPKVIRTAYFDGTFTFDGKSTSQERENMLGIISNLFSGVSQPVIDGMLVDLEDAY